jgi:hypothetical protein
MTCKNSISWQYYMPELYHRYLAGVTLIIPARFLNQEPGSYFYWKFQEGIKERIADFGCVESGLSLRDG